MGPFPLLHFSDAAPLETLNVRFQPPKLRGEKSFRTFKMDFFHGLRKMELLFLLTRSEWSPKSWVESKSHKTRGLPLIIWLQFFLFLSFWPLCPLPEEVSATHLETRVGLVDPQISFACLVRAIPRLVHRWFPLCCSLQPWLTSSESWWLPSPPSTPAGSLSISIHVLTPIPIAYANLNGSGYPFSVSQLPQKQNIYADRSLWRPLPCYVKTHAPKNTYDFLIFKNIYTNSVCLQLVRCLRR